MKFDTEDLIIEIVEDNVEPEKREPEAKTQTEPSASAVTGETSGRSEENPSETLIIEEIKPLPQEVKPAEKETVKEEKVRTEEVKPAAEEIPEEKEPPAAGPDETRVIGTEPGTETFAPESQEIKTEEAPVIRQQTTEKRPIHITEEGRLPLSVAIETDGGLVSRIAQIGDVLPVKCIREFSTGSAAAKAVALNLYAGERPVAAQNRQIAKLKITGIEKLPAGRPVITVNFEIDRDWTIHVEALDEGSLHNCSKTIDSSWKPSDEEIYEIVREAQDHLEEDNKIRERSRLLRNARECLFRADRMLRTRKKELSSEQRREIKGKSKRLVQRVKKLNVLDMTELNEKAVADAVNSLDNALRLQYAAGQD